MDSIGNIINSIKNSFLAKHQSVKFLNTRKAKIVTNQLLKMKVFSQIKETDGLIQATFADNLINLNLRRISKPGRKLYIGFSDLPIYLKKRERIILSTSKGVFTDSEAREKRIGGEILFSIMINFSK